MPTHSRSRDRHRGFDSDRERERVRERDSGRRYRDEAYDDEPSPDPNRDRRRRQGKRREHRSRGDSRGHGYGYDSHDHYESPTEDTRLREAESPLERSGRRDRGGSKAKESPGKRRREGHRRERGSGYEYEYDRTRSPDRQDRGTRRDERRERHRDGDRDAARRHRRRDRDREAAGRKHQSSDSTNSASHLLSADALARLSMQHDEQDRLDRSRPDKDRKHKRRKKRPLLAANDADPDTLPEEPRRVSKGRVASGAYLEEGRSPGMQFRRRGGGPPSITGGWRKDGWDDSADGTSRPPFWKRKKWWIALGVVIVLLAIIIPVAVVVSKKKDNNSDSSSSDDQDSGPSNSNLDGISRSSIPESAKGTILDPFTWYDTTDFNVTYTNETVGGLPIMGLNSTWDDSTRPNKHVPPLNEPFPYGERPFRGVNLGGWLSIEPFITPSLFDQYSLSDGVIDEWTLSKTLGASAASRIEKHYAKFINEKDFAEIRDAGMDHVRIQYSYWAVKTYDGDPYVPKIAWRYLLRAIEYCRKYGLRVKLDFHGIPGSQNGWNHSGRQGIIRWINSTEGELNRKRSMEIHDQVSRFFAQDRYKNILTIYGLVNEPLMLQLPIKDVLEWSRAATKMIQDNGIKAYVTIHDGFLNLQKWDKMLQDRPPRMILDTHQYTTFNVDLLALNHTAKVNEICDSWYNMISNINSTSTGWGPTMCGEWSQADTDCAKFLNNVGRGTRWEGTFNRDDPTPHCPTADDSDAPPCTCSPANADPSEYSPVYKKFLQTYAEAQMSAFEQGEGWFYWTWRTESAAQWSYRAAWKHGYMPRKAYKPDFKCGDEVPSFDGLPENY